PASCFGSSFRCSSDAVVDGLRVREHRALGRAERLERVGAVALVAVLFARLGAAFLDDSLRRRSAGVHYALVLEVAMLGGQFTHRQELRIPRCPFAGACQYVAHILLVGLEAQRLRHAPRWQELRRITSLDL